MERGRREKEALAENRTVEETVMGERTRRPGKPDEYDGLVRREPTTKNDKGSTACRGRKRVGAC